MSFIYIMIVKMIVNAAEAGAADLSVDFFEMNSRAYSVEVAAGKCR
jgi:hypothetical protein